MSYKALLSAIAIVLTIVAFIPYLRSVHAGRTRPHIFSWVIWGVTTFVVFLAQLADKGGAGAWPLGVSGLITLYVAALALSRHADRLITRTDWVFFVSAMSSLPLWYLTQDPLWTVLILTTVDTLGFGPTFRKAYHFPFDEPLVFFMLMASRNLIAILALEHYSITTVLFPAVTGLACALFMVMVVVRRRQPENH